MEKLAGSTTCEIAEPVLSLVEGPALSLVEGPALSLVEAALL